MIELGQLERRHEDFEERNTQVIVVSVEPIEEARRTRADFPHLLVLADTDRGLSEAVELIHAHEGPDGSDIAMPTTILVDRDGIVHWLFRPSEVITRLSPDDVLQAIDKR
jgi:alkyl hydroperoxide reductase subunit AhpC